MQTVGLLLNLLGVFLLFRFGMPYRVFQINQGALFKTDPSPKEIVMNRRYKFWGWVGLISIFLGTFAQVFAAGEFWFLVP